MTWPIARPLLVVSLIARSDLYIVYGKTAPAKRYLQRAAWIDPNNSDLINAEAFAALTDTPRTMDAARAHLIAVAQHEQGDGRLWLSLAIMDARLHHYAAATTDINIAAKSLRDPTTLELQRVLNARR